MLAMHCRTFGVFPAVQLIFRDAPIQDFGIRIRQHRDQPQPIDIHPITRADYNKKKHPCLSIPGTILYNQVSNCGRRVMAYLQLIVQAASLVLFIFLTIIGKVQVWMGIFVISIFAVFLLGRVYCGWICPINTATRCVSWLKKKLRVKSARIPGLLTKPWIRLTSLGLFITAFIFTMISGKKLPVLPALFALGIMLTLVFPEELWHRYLCPYGLILSLPARKSNRAMTIDSELCNGCGMCARVCPAKAVEKNERRHEFLRKECLVCMECSRACKQKAIHYR